MKRYIIEELDERVEFFWFNWNWGGSGSSGDSGHWWGHLGDDWSKWWDYFKHCGDHLKTIWHHYGQHSCQTPLDS